MSEGFTECSIKSMALLCCACSFIAASIITPIITGGLITLTLAMICGLLSVHYARKRERRRQL